MPFWTRCPPGIAAAAKALAFPALLLLTLELYTRLLATGSDALAPPSQSLQAWAAALRDGSDTGLWQATGFTLLSAGAGLALGSLLALGLGLWLGLSRRAAAAGFLSIEVLRTVPSVALIPLAMLVFGFGYRMEIAVVAFATFWPLLILTQSAVRQVEPGLLEVAAALQLTAWARTTQIVLPAVTPRLLVALRLGVQIALVVAVTVEIAANPSGMGYAMMLAQQSLAPDLMLAWLGWIGVVGYAVNSLMLRLHTVLARRLGGREEQA